MLRAAATIAFLVLAGTCAAQTAAPDVPPCSGTDCASVAGDAPVAPSQTMTDTGGTFQMPDGANGNLLFGISTVGGIDTNPAYRPESSTTGFYILSPFVGVRFTTPRTSTVVQYQLKDLGLNSQYSNQILQQASASFAKTVTGRWSLQASATASHGQNSVRLLASPAVSTSMPGITAPASTSYLTNADIVTNAGGVASIGYGLSERDDLSLQVSSAYTKFGQSAQSDQSNTAPIGSNGVNTVYLTFGRLQSPTLASTAFLQESFSFGTVSCASHGIGVGFRWSPNDRTRIAGNAGPQVNQGACGTRFGVLYSFNLNRTLDGRSEVYVLAQRLPASSYVGPGLWQETYRAGYGRQVGARGSARADFAYVKNTTTTTDPAYRGTYVDVIYTYQLTPNLSAGLNYQVTNDRYGTASLGRNLAFLSLTWTPDRLLPFHW